ncbi:MAG: hypothetical protein ACE5FI_18675, partial [Anaerolineales bacterium]
VATNATTDGSIQVMGSESPALAAPGEPMFFMVYYQKLASEQRNLYGSVQLIDSVGQKLGQVDQALGTGSFPDYPYSEWRLDEVVRDQFLLFAPNDIVTPAVLDVLMVVYDRDTGERIAETWLSPVAITTIAQATIPSTAVRLEHSVGLVELLAADTRLAADQLEITLYWQVADAVPVDGVVFIHLYDGAGNFVQGNDSEPLGGRYPMSVWQPGETIVDEHRFVVSVLARGAYSVHAGIYDPITGERFPITAPNGQRVLNDSLEIGQVQIP